MQGNNGLNVISLGEGALGVKFPGGGGNLTCLWYGVVPFFRVPFFMIVSGFMGMVFNNFWHLPDLWV